MNRDLFQPSSVGQIRLLLLIDAFSGTRDGLEGRTKLAKLDFLLRYPAFFRRAMAIKAPNVALPPNIEDAELIETRMVRYRYGPWDPAYFALLGGLIGRGLTVPVFTKRGISYRNTEKGHRLAAELARTESWGPIATRVRYLYRHFNLSGTTLKEFVYANFPEVANASWGSFL